MYAGTLDTVPTPFYLYDTKLLADTLDELRREACTSEPLHIHYAVKANANPVILRQIAAAGFGADCVSGGEIRAALDAGFPAAGIVFAGVGKADWEIRLALESDIAAFNVESREEMAVIEELAAAMGRTARVCLRINPNVGAHTHANITTGLAENKFGIDMADMLPTIQQAQASPHLSFEGLHFHIGSQIEEMDDFCALARKVNELLSTLAASGIMPRIVNVGGGLGINYCHPHGTQLVPRFRDYFDVYRHELRLKPGQEFHCELGRAIVAQMGSLITRVLYVKHGRHKRFAIVDAGMTELIRPALYDAHHCIETMSIEGRSIHFGNEGATETYDIVGPICESSDVFARDRAMPPLCRGQLLAIRSAGAYGEAMASTYNCRPLPKAYTMKEILSAAHANS